MASQVNKWLRVRKKMTTKTQKKEESWKQKNDYAEVEEVKDTHFTWRVQCPRITLPFRASHYQLPSIVTGTYIIIASVIWGQDDATTTLQN